MKASKKQADAVRSYLSSIGHEITHVQALEVIARGNGFRSRHVKGVKATPSAVVVTNVSTQCTVDVESKGIALRREFGEDNEHPFYPRAEWLATTQGSAISYWTWVATQMEPEDETPKPCIEMSSELFGSETFEYVSNEDRERGLMRLIAAAVTQKDDVPREYRFFEATPDTPDGGTTYGELEATVYGDGVVELRGKRFARPELARVDDSLVFTGRNLPEEPVGKALQEKLCLYNILSDSEECGTDVCPYSTPEKREAGLMRMLANDVSQDDGIERRYWRYERDLQVGDEVRIPAPSSVSQDKDAFGAVKSIDYAARQFVVTVSGVDIPFEFEMLALMTLPFIDRISNTQARLIMSKTADAVFTENCDVILDGKHYNQRDIRLKKAHGDKYFVPKK